MTQACHVVHRKLASRPAIIPKIFRSTQAATFKRPPSPSSLLRPSNSPFSRFLVSFFQRSSKFKRIYIFFFSRALLKSLSPTEIPSKISKQARSSNRGYLATLSSGIPPPVALLDVCREGADGLEGATLKILAKEGGDSDFRRESRPIQAHPGEAAFNHSIAA